MRNVLIVSPHFPPVNAPDHQRVRMSLPYLKEFGWSATVLAVEPEAVEGATIDPLLERTLPSHAVVERVGAVPAGATRLVGVGNLALRAMPYLYSAGNRLLKRGTRNADGEAGIWNSESEIENQRFDLVFFSTTQFPVMILGPIWKRKFGVPYVVDMQDPWLDDYYARTGTEPPGGATRHGLSRNLAAKLEPRVMRDVAHVISVSPSYVRTLADRYPHLQTDDFTVLPFGAPERDFELLPKLSVQQRIFDRSDGKQHWLYVGRGGDDMAPALRLLFSTLAKLRHSAPEQWQNVRLYFAGTSYAPSERATKTIEPIACEFGVEDIVAETTDREPYLETLKALTEADALLVIGSDSPSYSASKLYPYMVAGKPMLSILHKDSPAVEILRNCRAGEVVTFDPAHPEQSEPAMKQALIRTMRNAECGLRNEVNADAFNRYSAREMTRRMCEVFDRAVARHEGSS